MSRSGCLGPWWASGPAALQNALAEVAMVVGSAATAGAQVCVVGDVGSTAAHEHVLVDVTGDAGCPGGVNVLPVCVTLSRRCYA